MLRIEDTDRTRFVAGAEKYIIDSLAWLGISPDDGVNLDGTAKYRQSEREYKSFIDTLVANGHAYYAFDTSEEIEAMREELKASGVDNNGYNHISREKMKNSYTLSAGVVQELINSGANFVIRFNTPKDKEIKFTDLVKGEIVVNSNTLDDKVLFKSDGLPTYHLANVVDDHLMAITHVIRGDEWLPSAPLHIMLYEAFGWTAPTFCHLPLILGPDGKKLSKRHGDKYGFPVFPMTWDYINETGENIHITGFKDENFEPQALVNFLSLLGWNPGNNQEIMTLTEMISLFDLDRINNAGAMFDIEKLKSFNAHYMRNKGHDMLFSSLVPHIKMGDSGMFEMPYSIKKNKQIVEIAKERVMFAKDLYSVVSYFYEPVILKDDVTLKNPFEFTKVMESVMKSYLNPEDWTASFIKADMEALCDVFGCKIGKILPDLRMALTGGIPGPHLPETMEILGREESFKRIKNLLTKAVSVV